jgi:predicted transposase/invertase (TIGR01784 family)
MALKTIIYRGQEIFLPKYDRVFKAVLTGEDKTLLGSFLSSILEREIKADEIIVENPEFPGQDKEDKSIYLDLWVTLKDGTSINVEIQVEDEHNMGKRSMYNIARIKARQMRKKGDYGKIPPAISVNLLDFDFITDSENYHNTYRMINVKTFEEMPNSETLEIIFIESPKLPKIISGKMSMKDLWVIFIFVHTEEVLEMLVKECPTFETAANEVARVSANKEMRLALEIDAKRKRDYHSAMATREQKGWKEHETMTVKNMNANGFTVADIAKAVNLSIEDVERILKKT